MDGQAPSGFRATLNNLKKEVKTLEESDDENDGEEKFYPGGFQSFNMQVTLVQIRGISLDNSLNK